MTLISVVSQLKTLSPGEVAHVCGQRVLRLSDSPKYYCLFDDMSQTSTAVDMAKYLLEAIGTVH